MKKTAILGIALLLPLQALLAQQDFEFRKTASAAGAKKGTVTLEIPAGELQVKADGASLVEAQVLYTMAGWLPVFTSNNSKTEPEVSIRQKEKADSNGKNAKNDWNINLSKTTPIDLYIKMGAGQSRLDLQNSHIKKLTMDAGAVGSDIDLRGSQVSDVTVNAGVGEVNLDLRGDWNHDVDVDVSGGIGDVRIRVPKGTGVRVKSSGMGSRNMDGLQKVGNAYVNEALGKSKHVIDITVTGGLGSISVQQDK